MPDERTYLQKIFLPDRTLHVVRSTDEAEALQSASTSNVEYIQQGSEEHVQALNEAQAHLHNRRNGIKNEHPEIYAQLEHIASELDNLQSKHSSIDREAFISNLFQEDLSETSGSNVELKAMFDRYGYDAKIRTHGVHEDDGNPTLYIWKRPNIRQYFHKGILYRSSNREEVMSFEMFLDLIYVGILEFAGESAAENPTGIGLVQFCILFIPSWRIWSDMQILSSTFETRDVIQRMGILLLLSCLIGYCTNMASAFEGTYLEMITFFLIARGFVAALFLIMACMIKAVRQVLISNAVMIIAPSIIWIGSLFLEEPQQYALIWIAIFIDLIGLNLPAMIWRFKLGALGRYFGKVFQYLPAVNVEHRTERTGNFVILVLGYSVTGLLYQSAYVSVTAFFGKAILGLMQGYGLCWLYFENDNAFIEKHAVRRHVLTSILWTTFHLPYVMSLTLWSSALARLVVAHDCPNANPDNLTERYLAISEEEISSGLRFFYCGGLSVALLCTVGLAISHIHIKYEGQRITKYYRLVIRSMMAFLWLGLSFSHLNSLNLLSVITATMAILIAVETYGMSRHGDKWISMTKSKFAVAPSDNSQSSEAAGA